MSRNKRGALYASIWKPLTRPKSLVTHRMVGDAGKTACGLAVSTVHAQRSREGVDAFVGRHADDGARPCRACWGDT